MTFEELNLIAPIREALHTAGYLHPTPIQAQAIPPVLQGQDLLAVAQTGTGKTAAFCLPILQRLHQHPAPASIAPIRALILVPTRELAVQVSESLLVYGQGLGLGQALLYGGMPYQPQLAALAAGAQIVVATPGRLLDFLDQGHVALGQLQVLVLDEADRMLDLGFLKDIQRLLPILPADRQTLLFSATMPPAIAKLARKLLRDPVRVEVTPASASPDTVTQTVYYVKKAHKHDLLVHLLQELAIARTLVFTRSKESADKVTKALGAAGVAAEAIHADKPQAAREKALENFKQSATRVLVATDLAARGLDVDTLTHVVNYELPFEPETYVHRIGRTGRAGAAGQALSFCDPAETPYLLAIQALLRKSIRIVDGHPYPLTALDYILPPSSTKGGKGKAGKGGKRR